VQKVGYDPAKDFDTLCLLASNAFALVVHPSVPANNLAEFIALLHANPGKYAYSSSGAGSTSHLMIEKFNASTNVSALHVPYKGSSPSITDLIGGRVAYTIETVAAVMPHVKAGKLRVLAVTSAQRASALPDVPTIAEAANLPGFDLRGWIGFLAPAGIPREARQRLATETQKIVESAEMRERFIALGLDPSPAVGDEFAGFMKRQGETYSAVAKSANIKLD
jgi:tripartite-type tricarboxylate transporter receptor subunit TctC